MSKDHTQSHPIAPASTHADRQGPRLPPLRKRPKKKRAAAEVAELAEVAAPAPMTLVERARAEHDRAHLILGGEDGPWWAFSVGRIRPTSKAPQKPADVETAAWDPFAGGGGLLDFDAAAEVDLEDLYNVDPQDDRYQDRYETRATAWPPDRLLAEILRCSKVGSKKDAPCLYAATVATSLSWDREHGAKLSNVAGVRTLIWDFDDIPESAVEPLKAACARRGTTILHTTSSHDPASTGMARIRAMAGADETMTPDEYAGVWRALDGEIRAEAGIITGSDTMAANPVEAFALPRFPSADVQAQAWGEIVGEGAWSVRPYLERTRRELARERRIQVTTGPIAVDGRIDRHAGMRRDLEAGQLWDLRAGEGRSFKGLFRAAMISAEWALSEAETRSWYVDHYTARGHRSKDLEAKIRAVYKAPPTPRRYLRAAGAAPWSPADLPGLDSTVDYRSHEISINQSRISCDKPTAPQGPAAGGRRFNLQFLPPRPLASLAPTEYVRSATGTGKTTWGRALVADAQSADKRVVIVVMNRSLARSGAGDYGVPCYLDLEGDIIGDCIVCLDSIHRIRGHVDLVIVDESNQVYRHLFGGTILKKGLCPSIASAFRRMLRNADHRVFMDADLDMLTVECTRAFMGHSDGEASIWNERVEDVEVEQIVDELEFEDDVLASLEKYVQDPASQPPVDFGASTKSEVQAIFERACTRFPVLRDHSLVIDGDCSGEDEQKAAIADTANWANYVAVFRSPSVRSGVSVTSVESKVYVHCKAGAGSIAQDCKQIARRVRRPHEGRITYWAGGSAPRHETSPDLLREKLARMDAEEEELLREAPSAFDVVAGEDGPLAKFESEWLMRAYCLVRAYEARWSHLADTVDPETGEILREGAQTRHFREIGWTVLPPRTPTYSKDEVKASKADKDAAKMTVERTYAKAVIAAEDKTEAEIAALDKDSAIRKVKYEVEKFRIKAFYGVDTLDESLVINDRRGRRRTHLRARARVVAWQRGHREPIKLRSKAEVKEGSTVGWRHLARASEVAADFLALFGITDLAEHEGPVMDPGELSYVMRRDLQDYWGIREKVPMRALGALLRALGHECGIDPASKQVRGEDGARRREYILFAPCQEEANRHMEAEYQRLMAPPPPPRPAVCPDDPVTLDGEVIPCIVPTAGGSANIDERVAAMERYASEAQASLLQTLEDEFAA